MLYCCLEVHNRLTHSFVDICSSLGQPLFELLGFGVVHRVFLYEVTAVCRLPIAAVVVPAAMPAVVVVPQDHRVDADLAAGLVLLRDVRDAVVLLRQGLLQEQVVLALDVLLRVVEVQLVVLLILGDDLGALHVETDREDALEREVWVLDVLAVDLLVPVEEIRVLEFLDRLVRDLADPVVDAEATVFQDQLLQVIELITVIIVRVEVLDQLNHKSF